MFKKAGSYKTKKQLLHGSSFSEVRAAAERIYKPIKSKTKRTPYVRSKYFRGEKIFLTLFWSHIFEKSAKDRIRRLKFFDCAIDLIRSSMINPESRENFRKKDEILHRFHGVTGSGEKFVVQIKENKRTKRKDFISVYPL